TTGSAGTALVARAVAALPRAVPVQATTAPATTGAGDAARTAVAWLDGHPWAAPLAVPDGYRVAAVRVDPDGREGLEADLAGPQGLIVLTQVRGLLDPEALPAAVAVAGRRVHVLSDAPWHVVWQSGDAVVSVSAELRSLPAEDVVGSYPAVANDDGVPARIARGWQVLAGVWSAP
ncbi:MAG TPA: zf-HC2 domain-containing protein, partial [Actinotalea sp.]|nr:zf-HC2 domain-containing protein [Actinotalea sp.]